MKKIIFAIVFLFVIALSFVSCHTSKNCPAYPLSQTEQTVDINVAR